MDLIQEIIIKAKEEYLYTLGDGLVGFYIQADLVEQLITDSIALSNKGYEAYIGEGELLNNVTPFYMSQTKHVSNNLNGWLDPAYTLTQYAVDYDITDFLKLSNCISYQMNAASRAVRLSSLLVDQANSISEDKPVGKGLIYLSAALLNKYETYTLMNLDVIRKGLKDKINDFTSWYMHTRGALLCSDEMKYVVPRIDAFCKGGVLIQKDYRQPVTNINQATKQKIEMKQVKHYIAMMILLLKAAAADEKSTRLNS